LGLTRVESTLRKVRFHADFTPRGRAISRPRIAGRESFGRLPHPAATEPEERAMNIQFNLSRSARQIALAFALVAAADALPLVPAAEAQTLASRTPAEAAVVDVMPAIPQATDPILFPRFGYLEFDEMVPEGATDADLYGERPAEVGTAQAEYSE
jgi:hypothetical protein